MKKTTSFYFLILLLGTWPLWLGFALSNYTNVDAIKVTQAESDLIKYEYCTVEQNTITGKYIIITSAGNKEKIVDENGNNTKILPKALEIMDGYGWIYVDIYKPPYLKQDNKAVPIIITEQFIFKRIKK